uniref:Uncharacterized protein n=1 Tax=Lygus hesperus TaxID=30085 RepID=A0A0K8T094_LYGHE
MSLNDRFTQLRRPDFQVRGVLGGRVDTIGSLGGSSAKNKKLALQMSRRPTVVAALARVGILLFNVVKKIFWIRHKTLFSSCFPHLSSRIRKPEKSESFFK